MYLRVVAHACRIVIHTPIHWRLLTSTHEHQSKGTNCTWNLSRSTLRLLLLLLSVRFRCRTYNSSSMDTLRLSSVRVCEPSVPVVRLARVWHARLCGTFQMMRMICVSCTPSCVTTPVQMLSRRCGAKCTRHTQRTPTYYSFNIPRSIGFRFDRQDVLSIISAHNYEHIFDVYWSSNIPCHIPLNIWWWIIFRRINRLNRIIELNGEKLT